MQDNKSYRAASPVFPYLLSLPISLVPAVAHSKVAVTVLNRAFARAIHEGELDYLQDRIVQFHVQDMQLAFQVTLQQRRLVAVRSAEPADLTVSGDLHAFLLLTSRREDADTLFFQRRLRMEGNTELGLYIKNFLDGLDLESHWLPRQIENLIISGSFYYELLTLF